MLFCKLLWLFSLVLLGVAARAFILTTSRSEVQVNVRQNATLQWNYEVSAGETYDILWGTSFQGINVKDLLFRRNERQTTARPSPKMPSKFAGRVKIIQQATLFIRRVDLSDEGFYVCLINGQFVTLRKAIKLVVIDPPRILTPLPQKDVWNENDAKELTCDSDGKPKPRVTWRKDNKILKKARKKAKLDFPSVTYRDAGLYTCIAENVGGRKQKHVEISVLYAPKDTNITTDAPQDTVSDGSFITIICKAHGNPAPKYKFYIGDESVRDRKAERSGVLKLTMMSSAHSGIYSCEPENDRGRGPKKEVTVYVRHSPKITLRPGNKFADEDALVSVRCEAEGFPAPTIKWVKLLGNRNVGSGISLLIPKVRRSDQGHYRCIATNGFGDDATAEFKINVYYAPKINKTASSQNVPAWAGTMTNLTCVADGNPAPRYIWTNRSGVVATSEESGLLRVTPQGANGFGPYTCTVVNNKGRDQLAISLVKVDKPVVQLKVQSSSSDSLSLTWLLLSDESSNYFLQYYTLQYRTVDTKSWIKAIKIRPKATTYQLIGLKPYTEYIVELYATNKHFTSNPSQVRKRTTEAAPSPPQNVKAFAINGSAIHVTWTPPLNPNGPLRLYTVLYDKTENYFQGDEIKLVSVMSNVTEAFIGGLNPFTNYTVKVKVLNSIAEDESATVTVVTMAAAPSEPLNQEANITGPHSVRLRWTKPLELNGIVVVFKVRMLWRFKNVKGDYKYTTRTIPAKVMTRARRRRSTHEMSDYTVLQLEPNREIELRRLQPFAIISIRVAEGTRDGKNNILWSPFSNNQTVETMEGAPSAPLSIQLEDKQATSLKVTWLPPKFPNGIIQKYRVIYSNNTGKNYTVEITKGLKNATLFYTISGLKKDTDYQIYVQAFTNYPGDVSPPVNRDIKSQGDVLERGSGVDNGSLYGGVFAGIIILAFVIIIVVLVIRKQRKRRDSTELNGKRYAVANSNDSGIGDKESLDRVPGVKYMQGVRRGSEGSESWV